MAAKINIGLIGYGNVGKGVVDYFADSHNPELDSYRLVRIGVKDGNKCRDMRGFSMTTNPLEDIIGDPSIQIVLDTVGGNKEYNGASMMFVTSALEKGKHVVTCNKSNLAYNLGFLTDLACRHNANLQYEASVCGGIPVIRNMRAHFSNDNITKIVGIINGTSNYILTQMHQGKSYGDALAEAQGEGFAEKDPSSDVKGDDAQFKLAILASLGFHTLIRPEMVQKEGISDPATKDKEVFITNYDIFYVQDIISARRCKKHVIKPIALAEIKDGKLELRVCPAIIDEDHPLFGADNSINRICIRGEYSGTQIFGGPGAGGTPTGYAVISDMFEIGKKIQNKVVDGVPDFSRKFEILENPETLGYIKSVSPEHQTRVFERKARALGDQNIDVRDITNCHEFEKDPKALIPDMFSIERTPENNIKRAIQQMRELDCVQGPVVYVREDRMDAPKNPLNQ